MNPIIAEGITLAAIGLGIWGVVRSISVRRQTTRDAEAMNELEVVLRGIASRKDENAGDAATELDSHVRRVNPSGRVVSLIWDEAANHGLVRPTSTTGVPTGTPGPVATIVTRSAAASGATAPATPQATPATKAASVVYKPRKTQTTPTGLTGGGDEFTIEL